MRARRGLAVHPADVLLRAGVVLRDGLARPLAAVLHVARAAFAVEQHPAEVGLTVGKPVDVGRIMFGGRCGNDTPRVFITPSIGPPAAPHPKQCQRFLPGSTESFSSALLRQLSSAQ